MSQESSEVSFDLQKLREQREQAHLWFEEWRLNVYPAQEEFRKWTEVSVQYAQIALRAAFILNGGGLIALPPLMQWLSPAQRAGIGISAGIFILGLVLAAVAALGGYANFMSMAKVSDARAWLRAREVNNKHSRQPKNLNEENEYLDKKAEEERAEVWIERTLWIALPAGILSYAMFVLGFVEFRDLVAR